MAVEYQLARVVDLEPVMLEVVLPPLHDVEFKSSMQMTTTRTMEFCSVHRCALIVLYAGWKVRET